MNQYNPYLSPYINPMQQMGYTQQNVLPPQQILQVTGRSGIDALKMSPNSSVLIADSSKPVIYKCLSDSLGNTNVEVYDVSLHKEEVKVETDNIQATLKDLRTRIERLEYESFTSRRESKPSHAESYADEKVASNDEVVIEPQSDGRADAS